MINLDKRMAIYCLHKEGVSKRKISRLLNVSRKTVLNIIIQKGIMPVLTSKNRIYIDPKLLHKLYAENNGRINRIHERLIKDENIQIAYSTLTKRYRELSIASSEFEPTVNHPLF